MPRIKADWTKMQGVAADIAGVSNTIGFIYTEILMISNTMDLKSDSARQIQRFLSGTAANEVLNRKNDMRTLSKVLNAAAKEYKRAETTITYSSAVAQIAGIVDAITDSSNNIIGILDPKNFPRGIIAQLLAPASSLIFTQLNGMTIPDDWKPDSITGSAEKKYDDDFEDNGYRNVKRWGDEVKDPLSTKKDKDDFIGAEIGGKRSWSAAEGKASGSLGILSGEASYTVAEAEGTWTAGVNGWSKDEDGNVIFDPKLYAKAGASFTALSVAAAGTIGNSALGAYAKGEINVGRIGAEIGASASILDKNGNINPKVELSAGAEAILAEAKGSVGAEIGGVKAGVTGGVGIGAGMDGHVSYKDGKFSFGGSAYLGIGGSVNAEIDFSDAITKYNEVKEDIGKTIEGVKNVASDVAAAAGGLIDDAGKAVSAVSDWASSLFK